MLPRAFLIKGMDMTTMDDIAKKAGYGKRRYMFILRTRRRLLLIWRLKAWISFIALLSPETAKMSGQPFRNKYDAVCNILLDYSRRYPFYFSLLKDNINVDFDNGSFLPEEKETFIIGEKINECLALILKEAMDNKEIRQNDDILRQLLPCG